MIEETPTVSDFESTGKSILNMSWELVLELLKDLYGAEEIDGDTEEIINEYWLASQERLTVALSMVYQASELFFKARIVSESPYLLIKGSPSDWSSKNTKFSDFRTIDAQDLIKVVKLFTNFNVSQELQSEFNGLREKRNHFVHSVGKNYQVELGGVLKSILLIHKEFFPLEMWIRERITLLMKTPGKILERYYDTAINAVTFELGLVVDILSPSEVKKYFGFDKKCRKYYCPKCIEEAERKLELTHRLATLVNKKKSCIWLYCPVCTQCHMILRENCSNDSCSSNVLTLQEKECLQCYY